MEEARAGLGGVAKAVLGQGPAQVSALVGPDPPSQLPTAARHRVKAGWSPYTPKLLRTVQRLRREDEKSCPCPAAFKGALRILKPGARGEDMGFPLVSSGHLSQERPTEDQI